MGMGTIRGLITLALLLAFIALIAWVMNGRNKQRFDAAAHMPLEDDATGPAENGRANSGSARAPHGHQMHENRP